MKGKILLAVLFGLGLFLSVSSGFAFLANNALAQGPGESGAQPTPATLPATPTVRLLGTETGEPGPDRQGSRLVSTLATTVAGYISGTWTISDSPIVVTGDLVIASGTVLTIESGVEVRFARYYGLTVYGRLLARGTAAAPITFTSNMTSPQPGDWRGIRFYNSGYDDRLSHVRIEFAQTGIDIQASSDSSCPIIEFSEITRNSYDGISISAYAGAYSAYAEPQILTSTISYNGSRGIYLYGVGGSDVWSDGYAGGDIVSNTIANNGSYGIYGYGYGGSYGCSPYSCIDGSVSPDIIGNVIANNRGTAIYVAANGWCSGDYCNTGDASPLVVNNIIANNNGYGFYASGNDSQDDVYPHVINNDIVSNTLAGIQSTQEAYFDIINNLIISNTTGLAAYAGETPRVSYNDLWGNTTNFSNYPTAYGVITTTNANGDPSDAYYNIFLDPRFVNASARDYHLRSDSPAIDAGYDGSYYAPITDIDRERRPRGTHLDIGADEYWSGNSAPVIKNLPDRTLPVNTSLDNTIDLFTYTNDLESPDDALIFTIANTPAPGAGVSIDGNRYIDIRPSSCWTGQTDVVVRVTDPGGLSATDAFSATVTNSAPIVAGLPDQTVAANTSQDNAIDLWAYTSDAETPDSSLTFTIANTPAPDAGVSVDSNRYVDIRPSPGWTGQTDVVIHVADPCGLVGADTFSVTVRYSPPSVIRITPSTGVNTGTVHITNLTGSNFQPGATVKLTRSGQPNVSANNPTVVNSTTITCDFNLVGAAAGSWNVVVTNPDGQSGQLSGGFQVISAPPPTKIVYMPIIFGPSLPFAPAMNSIVNSDGDGNYTVSWGCGSYATGYILQEDDNSSFTSPTQVYSGTSKSTAITGKGVGTYYYRARAVVPWGSGPWSDAVSVSVTRTGIVPEPGTWYCSPPSGLTIRFSVSPDSSSASNGFMTAACGSKSIAGPATIQNGSFTLSHSDGLSFISAIFDSTNHAQSSFGFWVNSNCWALGNMTCSH